ncbi:probable leucine--tRNA ligase, mitochondrial [Tribolium madens]|uniref:probable leucine--tRNA ligase, mitochondrial n=1 Tax=Tribolium madens TaxID=41895 RepID=UPI001CF752B2|nr:probable leucine--tRNA ligase, mitochondrial [Tribolium madens]
MLYFTKLAPKRLGLGYRSICGLNLWHEEINADIKHKIEDYWRDRLKVANFDENAPSGDKYYVLSMFPYPSGSLHMGHVRVYTISDAIARFQRMNGKNVIHPIGWDAFGLPAENAAIERQVAPRDWTRSNISHMKSQLQRLRCSFEWGRELATCDSSYYKWTQDLFLKLYDSGLVYQKRAVVNWDPVDETVLADEQVDENGCSWRSGAKVEKKLLKQWFIRTTRFAKDLLEGLDDPLLQDWRDVIKLQKHWIGDCDGVNFDFKVKGGDDFLTLWTPKPEAINSVKFVALDSKHVLGETPGVLIDEGTKRLNLELVHPFSGAPIPVFVTNQIEFLPFTDTFVGIPSVCPQAAQFADKFQISYEKTNLGENERLSLQNQICRQASELGVGGYWSSAKLRDWLISRQRLWGTPIPIAHCDSCGAQPIRELPVELPTTSLSQKGGAYLKQLSDWVDCTCPKCNKKAKRETDTMDTFVDSSWYYLRYLDPSNSQKMFDENKAKKMMPVDLYIGGKEHAVLHLYYARFISHFLYSQGLLPEREPFKRLLVQGMVMGRSYRVKGTGRYVPESQVKVIDKKKNRAVVESTGEAVVMGWEKMSKSKHNGVDPGDMFREYGSDTTRLLILADVAPTSHRNWNSNTFPGILNWQKRLWLTIRDFLKHRKSPPPPIPDDQFKAHDDYMFDSRNYYIKGATFNYCRSQQHSVAISKQLGLTNSIRRAPPAIFAKSLQFERALAAQIILLAPMAPHFASELWSGFVSAPDRLNQSGEIDWEKPVLEQRWPTLDDRYNLDLVCKVNGVEVCNVKIPKCDFEKLGEEEAIKIALNQKEVKEILGEKEVERTGYMFEPDYEGVVSIFTRWERKEKSVTQ